MKKQRVYVDTSVIGGCFDSEFATWSNGLLRDFQEGNFLAVTSEVVTAEIEAAPEFVQEKYAEFLTLSSEKLDVTEQAIKLTTVYEERQILTSNFFDDGLHIALATIAEVDVLVSWNFKHIVHFNKIRLFNAVNLEQGYKPLQIYSPREVTTYGQE